MASDLSVETLSDLKRMLKDVGYSERAIREILEWFKQNNHERRA